MTLTKGLLGLGLSLATLTGASCSRPPTVLITVEDVPPEARSLHVIPAHMNLASLNDLEPFELPQPTPKNTTFLLRLPEGLAGDVAVQVAAYQQAGAKGCLLSVGDNSLPELAGQDSSLRVPLKPVTDTQCTGQRPLLLSASPTRGNTTGGETVTLTGWGFKPGGSVSFNGTAAKSIMYKTASTLEVSTPARVGIGPAEIKVANKDGQSHARKDLFRFFTNDVDFGGLPINDSTTVFDIGGLVVDRFYPSNPLVLVSMAASMRLQQEIRIIRVEFPLSLNDDKVDLRPLAPMGQMATPSGIASRDMDGDGIPDLVVAISDQAKVVVIKNDGAGKYTYDPVKSVFAVGAGPQGLAITDLNGDKMPDIVTANKTDNNVSVLINDGQGGFQPQVKYKTDQGPVSVVITDA
ncbi:MAG: FG-GAP-like repeat-containing protein [Polyangia bacterium]